ncbi:hypothetical protein JVU11DRAFT_7633 [Chiua virens]|nr:hypothetical protein JVU11DRAFT_7633 [Chiua virens]
MSDPFLRYTSTNDKFDRTTFSPADSEYNSDSHIPGQVVYFHPDYEHSPTTSPVTQGLRSSVPPQNEWVTSTPTYRSTPTPPFVSPPYLLPRTLRASAQIPFNTSSTSFPHSGPATSFSANPLISQNPTSVAMPIPSRNIQYSGSGLMDAHGCHYDASLDCAHRDDYVVEYSSPAASSFIPMPIVPTFPGAGPSNYMDPFLHSGPTRQRSPGRPTTAFKDLSPSDHTLTPSGSSDSGPISFSSPSSPFSRVGSHSLPVSPSSDSARIQLSLSRSRRLRPLSKLSLSRLLVPLAAVEFPPSFTLVFGRHTLLPVWLGETAGIWITSDKDAIKDHLFARSRCGAQGTIVIRLCTMRVVWLLVHSAKERPRQTFPHPSWIEMAVFYLQGGLHASR